MQSATVHTRIAQLADLPGSPEVNRTFGLGTGAQIWGWERVGLLIGAASNPAAIFKSAKLTRDYRGALEMCTYTCTYTDVSGI